MYQCYDFGDRFADHQGWLQIKALISAQPEQFCSPTFFYLQETLWKMQGSPNGKQTSFFIWERQAKEQLGQSKWCSAYLN